MDATPAASTPLRRLAGGALILAPALMFGGMLASPPQTDDSSEGYLASLAADYGVSLLSANLLHYAWVLIALSVPATMTLLRGRRGRGLTATGVALSAFGTVGFLATNVWVPDETEMLVEDLPVIQNLDLYREVGEIEFLKDLQRLGYLLDDPDPDSSQ